MKDYQLLVVAHPDDEALFFAALLLQQRKLPWKVICVTDGDADGQGEERREHWLQSMRAFAIADSEHWSFPDIFSQRLDVSALQTKLAALPNPAVVYTHGILGEYGHPHHQDVSFAVHSTFHTNIPVFSNSYNCQSDFGLCLTKEQFASKQTILWKIYGSQFSRFANKLPATEYEGFHRVGLSEISNIYRFLTLGEQLQAGSLIKYKHMHQHIIDVLGAPIQRPF